MEEKPNPNSGATGSIMLSVCTGRDYFDKCSSIESIVDLGVEGIENFVMFSSNDDYSLPFAERFRAALSECDFNTSCDFADNYNFFALVYGGIAQAVDVIIASIEYGFTPFVDSGETLFYENILADYVINDPKVEEIRTKANLSFLVYQYCNPEDLSALELMEIVDFNGSYNFIERLESALSKDEIGGDILSNSKVHMLVKQQIIDLNSNLYTRNSTEMFRPKQILK